MIYTCVYMRLNSPIYLVCDALVKVLWLLCIVIQAQPAELSQ